MIEYNGNIENLILDIKHFMLDNNIKQKDVAIKTGWTKGTVSNLLNNRTKSPSITVIYELCNAIGCNVLIKGVSDSDI